MSKCSWCGRGGEAKVDGEWYCTRCYPIASAGPTLGEDEYLTHQFLLDNSATCMVEDCTGGPMILVSFSDKHDLEQHGLVAFCSAMHLGEWLASQGYVV